MQMEFSCSASTTDHQTEKVLNRFAACIKHGAALTHKRVRPSRAGKQAILTLQDNVLI